MKLLLGFYTLVGSNCQTPVFDRALSFVLKPILTYLYSNKDYSVSLYEPASMMKFLAQKYPEVNLLISSLVKSGRLEIMTGTYNQNVLTLMQPKDRSLAIEKTTTLIRRLYGHRASTYFGYGQIWTPSVISILSKSGISRNLISSYDAISKRVIAKTPFSMNDLGKKVDILPYNDEVSKLVSSYAQNEIKLDFLINELERVVEKNRNEELIAMINIDQLCQGAIYNKEDDERLQDVFISIYEKAKRLNYKFALMKDVKAFTPGALDEGWYGRDVYTCALRSFREMFVMNGNYRYLLNRAIMVLDEVAKYKKDHDVKRELHSLTNCLLTADLFLCNTHLSALRINERRCFYSKLLLAERLLLEKAEAIYPDCYDLNEDCKQVCFSRGKFYVAAYNQVGGSVEELDYLPYTVNVFDTVPLWSKVSKKTSKLRSFTDSVKIGDVYHDFSEAEYSMDILNRAKTDFIFTLDDKASGLEINKHYKLRTQTLSLELTIINHNDRVLDFDYYSTIYFTTPGSYAFSYDSKRQIILGSMLKGIKNVRFADSDKEFVLSFTSTKAFDFTEDQVSQSEVSTLGTELLYLYTKGVFAMPVKLEKGESFSLSLATRIIDNKEKKNVFTK